MRFNWQFKQYYDAGVRLGNFWSIEIGAPQWIDLYDQVHDVEYDEGQDEEVYPLAEFYGAFYEELYGNTQYNEI